MSFRTDSVFRHHRAVPARQAIHARQAARFVRSARRGREGGRLGACRTLAAPAFVIAGIVALTGCTGAPTSPSSSGAPGTSASNGAAASGTATVRNCDQDVEPRTAPPERILTVKSTATELVAALGLGDAIVQTAFLDGEVPGVDAPTLDGMPAREAVLELDPDAIVVGWESAFAPEAAGDRRQLAALDITTWVSPAACRSTDVAPLTWDALWQEERDLAHVLGVDEAGERLVAEQQAALDAIEPASPDDGDAIRTLWYSSGEDLPYVGTGSGAPALAMTTAGVENAAADIAEPWATMSWEAFAASDPDLIVVVDASWHSAAAKIERLRTNPATASLEAVREERFVVVPFADAEAGVGLVRATAVIAEAAREVRSE